MPKGVPIKTRKKSNINDFVNYAKNNQNLSPKQIYDSYVKNSEYGIKKQRALDTMRQIFDYEVNEQKGKPIQEKKHAENEFHEVVKTPKPRKPREKKPPATKTKGKVERIILDRNKKETDKEYQKGKIGEIHYMDARAEAVKKLRQNIRELYNSTDNEFIQVSVKIKDDGYTNVKDFSVLLPMNKAGKNNTILQTGKALVKNLNTYYSNLAKKYTSKNYENLKNGMLNRISNIESNLKGGMKKSDLEQLFASEGITINSFKILSFVYADEVDALDEEEEEE